ncbi:uncharacterized protein OCT59_023509 [Rhizophagus irregularis]|uniref:Skt5p n=1 Tax=Rhizophagus irregularis (strain DAOM 197198w) TaxID=1432141 RepID=A0A015ID84_RHIIW|nr:Skt5p [Rhizophagus irregularis DAOM 197198w]UZO03096.1 hypothetical protein OCT59_023509 [Rhizophagus irregularis]GBC20459.1 kinase-like domain-containing protein [Rhizophagus irregularis DAOM 181602=DAOM 197198]
MSDNTKIYKLNSNLSSEKLSQTIIQNFDEINKKEIEPSIQNIHENIFEEDLSIVIDVLTNSHFKEVNEGKDYNVRKQHVLDYINDHRINLQEICNWLLINQNDSNSIYLLGYFNFHGIGMVTNKLNAFKLYHKAAELENSAAQFDLANIYIDGIDINKNYDKALELSKILAKKEYPGGINLLGYCYDMGIGTEVDTQKAFELYEKAANLGNSSGLNNLGCCYEGGIGTCVDKQKAFELYQKAADLGNANGINSLGCCYEKGVGTEVNVQKAIELFKKAANLENDVALYNLGLMYETGNGITKDLNQAMYWYKKSAEQGYGNAQNKLNMLLNV